MVPELSTWELLLRVAAAAALGGAVGFEREVSDQPAGFRTHILVSLGACLFTLAGAYGVEAFLGDGPARVTFDPTRVAAQVVTGIGFLGAGAILRLGMTVRGLTTAAALWVTAAIGTAVGLGYWIGAVATAAATVVSLYGLKRLEGLFSRLRRGRATFTIDMAADLQMHDLIRVVEDHGAQFHSVKIGEGDEGGARRLVVIVHLLRSGAPEALADAFAGVRGVRAVDWRA